MPPSALGSLKSANILSGPAGGDLMGTYPNPNIRPKAIQTLHIKNSVISGSIIANQSITYQKTNILSGCFGEMLIYTKSTQGRTSSTFAKDDYLYFPIGAFETYAIEGFLFGGQSTTTGGSQFRLQGPANPVNVGYTFSKVDVVDNQTGTTCGGYGQAAGAGASTGASWAGIFYGLIVNGPNPGIVGLEWAQSTTQATATTLYSGSSFIIRRLG